MVTMWLLFVNYVFLILLTRTGLSSGSCRVNDFDCENGRCISEIWRCDGDNDCGNLKDEHGCDNLALVSRCLSSQFSCESDQHCIPQKWHCDGEKDCEDGSDETKCDNATCTGGFTCRDHQCIPAKWRCDGNADCKDGSDEEACPSGKLCADFEFLCSSGSCVNLTLICDGKKDCIDGSDEGSHCIDRCENSTCSQNCRSTPSGPQCFCNDGYMLDTKDNKTCTDIDECLQEGFCSHQCTNTPGSYRCSCLPDYELVNRTCQAKGGEPVLIFSTVDDIRAMRLRTNEYFLVRKATSATTALDMDPMSQNIFWIELSNKPSVMSAKTDGTSVKTVIGNGLQVPEDIAVDYVANNLYLTDSGLRQVIACKVDGTMCHVLHDQNVEKPRSIVLDISGGLLYWSDWGDKAAGIYRSGMDGSRRSSLVSKDIGWPNGIAVDHTTNRLYWADVKRKTIEYVTLDGSSRKVVLNATVFHPFSLAVFEDTIYWSDWTTFALESCNKFTGHRMTSLAKEHEHIMGIHVFHPVLTVKVSNPCWSNRCSHMCLISPVSGFSCACPVGFELAEDSRTCKMADFGEVIFVNEGSSVFDIRPGVVGKETINEMSLPLSTATISKVAFDRNLRFLFVADISTPAIHAVNMSSLHMKVLIRNGIVVPEDLSFDWRSNNLYWIDSGRGNLEVISVDSLKRAVIVENLPWPIALAISPKDGHMFVATLSQVPTVTMYDMDGKIMKVLRSVSGSPISLALHPSRNILYWADPTIGAISFVNYTRSGSPRILHTGIEGVIGLAAGEESVYWTNRKREVHYIKGDRVHVLQLPGEERGIATRKVTYSSAKITGPTSACMIGNGGCSYVCLTSSKGITCTCPPELILAADNATCTAKKCEVTDFNCMDGQCLPAKLRCDGNKNCDDGSDETGCSRCPGNDFQCGNGRCIVESFQCDGRNDCGDNSDEEGCKPSTCLKDQIACSNGECISILWRCDGERDCADGTDESNCNVTRCDSDTHFRCDNGQCISIAWKCDKSNDCKDNSDERNCSFAKTCTAHEFKCESDSTCIPELMRCDRRDDCYDGSDEKNCPKNLEDCKKGMYECKDGSCIYDYEVCDGHGDCSHNEEELNCSAKTCKPGSVYCPASKDCILDRWICDGDLDCADGSDEDNCTKHEVAPKPTQAHIDSDCDGFYCYATHQCLALSQVCDGRQDCEALQDEGGLCLRSCHRNNGGCSHTCWKTPYGPRCSCKQGYSLNFDNKTCADVDECKTVGSCSHYCQNTKGGFKCSCADGYTLQNHRHCKVDGGPGIVLYQLGDHIRGYNLGNDKYTVYVETKITDTKGMDYDSSSDVFFWTEEQDGSINSYSRKLKKHNVILRSPSRPVIVRYDWIAKNLYYRDKSSAIVACSVDGKYCKTIIQPSNTNIESMDISPTNGVMFWTILANSYRGQHSGHIERAEMDGSHRIIIVGDNLLSPSGITVDPVLKLIYWSDKKLKTLECADFAGHQRRRIIETAYHPFAVAIFEDDVYWTDWGSDSINKCNRFTGKNDTVVIPEVKIANALMIVHDAMKPMGENKCLNSSCTHLCLLTLSNYKCVCDDGDNGTCSSSLISFPSLSTSVSTPSSTPSSTTSRSLISNMTKSATSSGLLSSSTRLPSESSPGLSYTSPPVSSKSPLSSECPKDYCQDGSECVVENGEYVCKCTPPYSGKSCDVKAAASIAKYDYNWIIALVFGLVMIGVIVAGIILCVRNREKLQRVSETVSVKFCNPKGGIDGRLVMDTDDGSLCEELVIEEQGECRQPDGESDYCAVDSEDGDLRKWPHYRNDSSLNANVVNFFRKLKLNASAL